MPKPELQIAKDLALPIDAVTQTFGILAIKRAGKSYCARRFAEQFHKAGQQIVIVDPKGDWWGIRSSTDGRNPGLPIVIIGGERGDVPLEPGSGEVVAKLIVEERVSALLDLSLLRKHQVATFMTGFLETVYRLKAREQFRTPVMLIIDEADAIAPQKPQKGEERMLGAAEDIVRRGGQRGIGCMLVSQRSAVLNKNVLTQCEILVALRTIGSQDLAALDAWVEKHGTREGQKRLMDSLPSLPTGDAWVWSPLWPGTAGIFERIHVLPIETFDSGATPKAGERRVEPKNLADVDLAALTKQMADTIERAKADDPKELRKRIAELERELKKPAASAPTNPGASKEAMEKATLRGAVQMANQMAKEFKSVLGPARKTMLAAVHNLRAMADQLEAALPPETVEFKAMVDLPAEMPARPVPTYIKPPQRSSKEPSDNGSLTGPEQRILDAIAWMESIGVDTPEQTAVAFLAGYTYGGGAFNNPRGALRTRGLVSYAGDCIALTDEGRRLANFPNEVLDSAELQRRVLDRLPGPERRILEVILAQYPRAMANDECATAAGYTPGGGAFNNPRGRLRTRGLIEYPQSGFVRARDLLFLDSAPLVRKRQ